MRRIFILLTVACFAIIIIAEMDSRAERVTANDYDAESVELPYGSPVEAQDFSRQIESVQSVRDNVLEKSMDAISRAEKGVKAAERLTETVKEVSEIVHDTVGK